MAAPPNSAQQILMRDMQELMEDAYIRMMKTCRSKCLPTENYERAEVIKSEAVCLDRCVFKYMELHERFGKLLGQKDEDTIKALHSPIKEKESSAS